MSTTPGNKSGISGFDFFCIGFGAIVGVGWAVSLNNWMANSGGPVPAAVGYLIALLIMIPVGLVYCEMVPMLPVAGGGAAYSYRAFGEKISFISGWAAFGAFVTIIPWEAIYVVDILSIVFPVLKSGNPLYTLAGADIYLGHIILGFIFSTIIFLLNWKGTETSATAQRYMCIFLIAAGIVAMISAAMKFDISNLQPIYANVGRGSHSTFLGGALAVLAFAPFFLAGFETIPQAIEDAGGSIKTVGFTVLLAVGLACVFYGLLIFTIGGAYPWQDFFNNVPAPAAANLFKEIYAAPGGSLLYYIILIGAICGLLTTWNGFMIASPLLMMAMGRANMIPQCFAKQHPKYGTPSNALIVCFVLSCLGPFLGMGVIDPLTSFSAAGFLVSWMLTSFSLVRLRKTEPDLPRPYKVPGGALTGWFAGICMTIILVMLFIPSAPTFIGKLAVILFICWMMLGFVLYFAAARQRNALPFIERSVALFAKNGENQSGINYKHRETGSILIPSRVKDQL